MDILTQWHFRYIHCLLHAKEMDLVGQTTSGQLEQPNGYRGMGNSAEDGSELGRVAKLKKFAEIG